MSISFFVPGVPKAQPRARSFALRGRGGKVILSKTGQPIIRCYESGTAEEWKSQVALAAKERVPFIPLQGPLSVSLAFVFPRPKAHFRANGQLKLTAPTWHTTKPDRDNLEKAVTDTLKTIGMMADDCQICTGSVSKTYILDPSHLPGCQVEIEPLEAQTPPASVESVKQPALL